jgi:hypothetical protein
MSGSCAPMILYIDPKEEENTDIMDGKDRPVFVCIHFNMVNSH